MFTGVSSECDVAFVPSVANYSCILCECDVKGEKMKGVYSKAKVKEDYFACCCNSYTPRGSETIPKPCSVAQ